MSHLDALYSRGVLDASPHFGSSRWRETSEFSPMSSRISWATRCGTASSAARIAAPRRGRDAIAETTACQYLILMPHYLETDGRANVHSDVAVAEGLAGALRNESRAHRRRCNPSTGPGRPWRRACRGRTTQQRIYLRCGCVSGARARALTGGAALSKCVYAAGRRREGRKLGTAVLPQGKRRLYAAGYDPDCFRIPCDSPTVLRLPVVSY